MRVSALESGVSNVAGGTPCPLRYHEPQLIRSDYSDTSVSHFNLTGRLKFVKHSIRQCSSHIAHERQIVLHEIQFNGINQWVGREGSERLRIFSKYCVDGRQRQMKQKGFASCHDRYKPWCAGYGRSFADP